MRFPKLQKLQTAADVQTVFGGYQHTDNVDAGAFYDCENISPDAFPLLKVRSPRAVWTSVRKDASGNPVSIESTRVFERDGITAAANVSDKLVLCSSKGIVYDGHYLSGATLERGVENRMIVPFGRNFFVSPDGIYVTVNDDGTATAVRTQCPPLDYAVEHHNRIWGCRYGSNAAGDFVNELYACALGDPTVWDRYDGVSTDSYCVSLGCSGAFTGVCKLGGDVLFFKEDSIIRVGGETPADFTVTVTPAEGAENGAFRSVVNVNDRVFYKSRSGITVFDGVLPYCVSEALGERRFTDVCAGTVGGRYYFAGTDPEGERRIYLYDTAHRLWYREDDRHNTRFFVYRKNCLYLVCRELNFYVGLIPVGLYRFLIHDARFAPDACAIFTDEDDPAVDDSYEQEPAVKWFAETGRQTAAGPQSLILRKLNIALKLDDGSKLKVELKCDGEEEWRSAFYCDSEFSGAFTLPVRLPRCDSYRLRLSGEGGCVINAITKVYEKTSGVNLAGR